MFFISLVIMIAGTIMCVYANSVWETQVTQTITTTLTTGLESLETFPIWMSSIRIWGIFCLYNYPNWVYNANVPKMSISVWR